MEVLPPSSTQISDDGLQVGGHGGGELFTDEIFDSISPLDIEDAGFNCEQVFNPAMPLFSSDYPSTGVHSDDVLFTIPASPVGDPIKVTVACAYGVCKCSYYLDDVKSQLLPCRFGYVLYGGFLPDPTIHYEMFDGIRDGFKVIDTDIHPYECSNYNSILSPDNKPLMDQLVRRELAEGFISRSVSKPECVHAMGAVPKGPNAIRPITDCSRPLGQSVNDHSLTLAKKFRYHTIQDVVDQLSPASFLSVIDIQAAYRAVPIAPGHRKFLGFSWDLGEGKEYYTDNRLCFGMTTGPFYFNSISTFVAEALWYCFGVRIIHYLDDYLVISPSFQETLQGQLATIKFLRFLGFHVAWRKISPPSTCTIYLGIEIDTVCMHLRLPDEKVQKFKTYVNRYASCIYITKKELEKLNGILSHCAQIVQSGRLFVRRCYDCYSQIVNSHLHSIKISAGMHDDLLWWKDFAPHFNGLCLIPYTVCPTPVWTDASLLGFGAIFGGDWLAGSWGDVYPITMENDSCGHFAQAPPMEDEHSRNINVLELWAVVAALERWAPHFSDKSVHLYVDNSQVMFMLRNSSSINKQCMAWLRRLFWLTMKFNVRLLPEYVPSEDNVAADCLSRIPYAKSASEIVDKLKPFDVCCFGVLIDAVNSRCTRPTETG